MELAVNNLQNVAVPSLVQSPYIFKFLPWVCEGGPQLIGIEALIEHARTDPAKPIVQGLFNEGEIGGLHGPREVYKTMFCLQLAESIASGKPLLGVWTVPESRSVFLLETEMSCTAIGERLRRMYETVRPPKNITFADEARLRAFRRTPGLENKFKLINAWVNESEADVLILDTANPCFRGKEDPNSDLSAGLFFDLLAATPALFNFFVRHDHKRKLEDLHSDPMEYIRGSGQFGDVPDVLMRITRHDKRTNEANLALTKFRHGDRPDDLVLWFDPLDFRLTSLPPIIHLLVSEPMTREQLLESLARRFHVSQRKADELINEQRVYLFEKMVGHQKTFQIDWVAAKAAPWFGRLPVGQRGEICKIA